ncbi:hypothetical protein Droror1_Dr00011216 [Drosera rotundifolia]
MSILAFDQCERIYKVVMVSSNSAVSKENQKYRVSVLTLGDGESADWRTLEYEKPLVDRAFRGKKTIWFKCHGSVRNANTGHRYQKYYLFAMDLSKEVIREIDLIPPAKLMFWCEIMYEVDGFLHFAVEGLNGHIKIWSLENSNSQSMQRSCSVHSFISDYSYTEIKPVAVMGEDKNLILYYVIRKGRESDDSFFLYDLKFNRFMHLWTDKYLGTYFRGTYHYISMQLSMTVSLAGFEF